MLNKQMIGALQALNGITNSAILKYPVTVLNNLTGDVVVRLNLEPLDSEPFEDMGIYNLSELISALKLFSDYKCTISDNIINIDAGENSVQYLTTSTSVLDGYNKDEKVFTSTESVPAVCSVKLSADELKTIKSAAGIFKTLEDIIIVSQDGDLEIKLGSSNNFNARSNSFSVKKPNSGCTKEFTVKVPAVNFNSLPIGDYELQVRYNEQRDAYRVLIKSEDIDMQVLMAVQK